MNYLKIECPNRLREDYPAYECHHLLAGVAIETLGMHDFSKPFKEMRYCQSCNVFWEVTIEKMGGVIAFDLITTPIEFTKVSDVFSGVIVKGRKTRGRSDNNRRNKGKQKGTK